MFMIDYLCMLFFRDGIKYWAELSLIYYLLMWEFREKMEIAAEVISTQTYKTNYETSHYFS
jgi:hypothetical protein